MPDLSQLWTSIVSNPLIQLSVRLAGLYILAIFLYLIVRPKETLGEAYERQLAEESLLAEAEQRVVCPTCKERVQEEFNLCPTCAKDFDERDWTVHPGGKVEGERARS